MTESMSTMLKSVEPILAPNSVDEKSVNDFIERVEDQIEKGAGRIVVDCSSLQRVTSSHINGLWLAYETCRCRRAELELNNVSEGLRRVLEALNLTPIILRRSPSPAGLNLQLHPTTISIDAAISRVIGHLNAAGIPEITVFEIQTIFYEIATNIRLHSGLKADEPFEVAVEIEKRRVKILFSDPGIEFDPTSQNNECNIQEAGRHHQRRGFGLSMIKGLCNSLSYSRTTAQRNELIVTKDW